MIDIMVDVVVDMIIIIVSIDIGLRNIIIFNDIFVDLMVGH
jgi:hypothetical protein